VLLCPQVVEAIAAGADIWFGNEAEAAALVQHMHAQQAEQQQARAALEQQQQRDASSPDTLEDEEQDFTAMQLERLGSSAANNKGGAGSSSSSISGSSPASPVVNNTNGSSAQQLSGMDAALQLASACPMVVVTDGSKGSYITALGQLVVVPPYWSTSPPVDTCGAGDAYAAGLLYGFLCGLDLHSMGHLAAKTASAVISKHGPQLTPDDAEWVVAGLRKVSKPGVIVADETQHAAAGSAASDAAATAKAAAVGGSSSGAADAPSRSGNGGSWVSDWAGGVFY
jgi:sugar/nucleoside kinase (ribokinase family)